MYIKKKKDNNTRSFISNLVKNIIFLFLSCEDVDECVDGSHNCHAEAMCSNTEGSFTCTCNTGYEGDGKECIGKFNKDY